MGPERSGRVRGYGLGPTPIRLWGSSSSTGQLSQHTHGERIKELEDKLEEMNAMIEDLKGLIMNMNLRLLAMEAKMAGMDTSQGPSSGARAEGGDAELCFLLGTLALGATKGVTKKKAMENNLLNIDDIENLRLVEELAKTCYEMYSRFSLPTGAWPHTFTKVIDGNKVIPSVASPATRVDDAEFEENEAYTIDIGTSTGDGKPKLLDERHTTSYKRAVDKNYHLKMKHLDLFSTK